MQFDKSSAPKYLYNKLSFMRKKIFLKKFCILTLEIFQVYQTKNEGLT